ncbi:hypothetical protein DQE80_17055, partial [Enterococcus sp. HPCN18]
KRRDQIGIGAARRRDDGGAGAQGHQRGVVDPLIVGAARIAHVLRSEGRAVGAHAGPRQFQGDRLKRGGGGDQFDEREAFE